MAQQSHLCFWLFSSLYSFILSMLTVYIQPCHLMGEWVDKFQTDLQSISLLVSTLVYMSTRWAQLTSAPQPQLLGLSALTCSQSIVFVSSLPQVATLGFKISSLLGLSAVSYLELTLNDSGMRITKRLNSKINFPNTFNKWCWEGKKARWLPWQTLSVASPITFFSS